MPDNIKIIASLLILALLSGCERESATEIIYSTVGPVPAEEQRAGDSAEGYQVLTSYPYITCGIPYSAYRQTADSTDPRLLLPGRSGRNAGLPYMLTSHTTEEGVELVVSNCLACHAGFFNDELIVGLGNENADWTNDLVVNAESVGALIEDDAEAAEWRKWADRIAAIAPYSMTDTIGVNPANNLTLALIAHHDSETLAWSPEPIIEPPPQQPLPVSVPPWWRMKKKNALFYSTEGRGDHARFMMTAALFCTDSVAEAREIDRHASDLRAFIASLEPPDYPFAINQPLAAQGKKIFENTCSRCHGTYDADWRYPNLVIALEEIGTDPALANAAMSAEAERFTRWYNESFFGELARAAPAPGYIAPPLDGVWATAPYLHNASVPTIETLLNSPERPKYWTRSFDSTDYDQQSLGWSYTELDHGKTDALQRGGIAPERIYDTTLYGYSNQGHTFGDHLNDAERSAVLEYLKTL